MQDDDTDDLHRSRAITKLRSELAKDIELATGVARRCGLWDLLRLCYLLRLGRVFMVVPDYRDKLTAAHVAELQMRDEALRYAIGLVAKHGKWAEDAIETLETFDNDRVDALDRYARHINAKFETETMLHVAKIRVAGERDQDVYFDIAAGLNDPRRSIYLYYGLRLERSTSRNKERLLSIPELVRRLLEDFLEVADLFEARTGISLQDFAEGLLGLDAALVARYQAAESTLSTNASGRVDMESTRTFVGMSLAIYFTDVELEKELNPAFVKYLRSHPFDSAAASESELQFHYLSRRPFLMGQEFAILSPDLFFDSVLSNAHFTLLEGADSKAPYMEAASSRFLDRVATVAARSAYLEVARDVDLKERKQDIGDIDLILYNAATKHTLLVEGKNHALPLPVYFRSADAIDAHVDRNRDWENKVKRRIAHLAGAAPSYQVEGSWTYLVVSLMPEPLSHLTDLLVLSLDEFEQWLAHDQRDISFKEFYERVYKPEQSTMSMGEMKRLQEEGYFLARPAERLPD